MRGQGGRQHGVDQERAQGASGLYTGSQPPTLLLPLCRKRWGRQRTKQQCCGHEAQGDCCLSPAPLGFSQIPPPLDVQHAQCRFRAEEVTLWMLHGTRQMPAAANKATAHAH